MGMVYLDLQLYSVYCVAQDGQGNRVPHKRQERNSSPTSTTGRGSVWLGWFVLVRPALAPGLGVFADDIATQPSPNLFGRRRARGGQYDLLFSGLFF